MTVGQLPAAVYWRRRALVCFVVLLPIVGLCAFCGLPGDKNAKTGRVTARNASSAPPASAASGEPTPGNSAVQPPVGPTAAGPAPGTGDPGAGSTDQSPGAGNGGQNPGAGNGGAGNGGAGNPGAGNGGAAANGGAQQQLPAGNPNQLCSDTDISLTGGIATEPALFGGTLTLTLTIRNGSTQNCSRDIGSAPQELRVSRNGKQVWSSDDCGTPQSSDVRLFGPGVGVQYFVSWDTYRVEPNACQRGTTPAEPGTYEVTARLGSLTSQPHRFDITR